MNINTASIYAQQGYKIIRAAWNDFDFDSSVYFKDDVPMIGDTCYIMTAEDLLADDWEIDG